MKNVKIPTKLCKVCKAPIPRDKTICVKCVRRMSQGRE